jgi:hypothetical protein
MSEPMVGKIVLAAIMLAAFVGARLLLRLLQRRWNERHPLGSVRCPECGTETADYRCAACGQSVQVERLTWKMAGYLPFLIVVILYLLLRRFAFHGAF